jgi:putative CocE/NonD family hydrolase
MSSWYDPYCQTAIDNFTGLSALKDGPIRLILGPWTHGDRSLSYAGDVDFGPEATLDGNLDADYWDLRVRWFDHWLRRVQNGVDAEPDVRYFRMGGGSGCRNQAGRLEHGGTWHSAPTWPPAEMTPTPYYLHTDCSLCPTLPDPDSDPLEYTFDPKNPVPSIGGTITSGEPLMRGGAFNQRETPGIYGAQPPYVPLTHRPDVLFFQTPPLTAPLELTGPIVAHLWIASDCPDTDFTAKLVDLHPPNPDCPEGFAMNLCDGILRVRYRESWSHPTLMKPGEVYALSIQLTPTSNLFLPGHRICLEISSSNFPHFDTNPNTDEPEGAATRLQPARNKVFVDLGHPSHTLLPVIH